MRARDQRRGVTVRTKSTRSTSDNRDGGGPIGPPLSRVLIAVDLDRDGPVTMCARVRDALRGHADYLDRHLQGSAPLEEQGSQRFEDGTVISWAFFEETAAD